MGGRPLPKFVDPFFRTFDPHPPIVKDKVKKKYLSNSLFKWDTFRSDANPLMFEGAHLRTLGKGSKTPVTETPPLLLLPSQKVAGQKVN